MHTLCKAVLKSKFLIPEAWSTCQFIYPPPNWDMLRPKTRPRIQGQKFVFTIYFFENFSLVLIKAVLKFIPIRSDSAENSSWITKI
jgi:hypothetical protein